MHGTKPAPRVFVAAQKTFARAQGWNQLVLALQRRRPFVQIGFTPPAGTGLWARMVRRRLQPCLERAWIKSTLVRRPQSLIHFTWGDDCVLKYDPDQRYIVTLHQPFERWQAGIVERCRQLGGVHVMTEREAGHLRAQAPGLHVRCIRHGIDVDFWEPPDTPPSGERKRVVFVGRYMRNLPMFFRLVRRLLAERTDVEIEMLLHQEFTFPPECLPLPSGVRTVGPFSAEEMRDFLQRAWLMLMPYDNVTASNSVCEALAAGLPFFTTRVGGMETYAQGGMVLFENNDDEAAHALVTRCLDDRVWRAELSAQARAAAVKYLDWDVIAAEFDAFYADVAAKVLSER